MKHNSGKANVPIKRYIYKIHLGASVTFLTA